MGIEAFNDRLIYCNPYANPLGWTQHLWGDFTPNVCDSPIVKFYDDNKNCNSGYENFSSELTSEQIKKYIKEHGGGLSFDSEPRKPKKTSENLINVGIGSAVFTGFAIAADYIFAKGKHVKQLTKFFKKVPNSNVKSAKPSNTGKSSQEVKSLPIDIKVINGKKFSSISEAETHFRNMGIDVDFKKCTDLRQLTQIDAEVARIKAMGIDRQVKSITVTPFDKQSMLSATNARGIELTENVNSGIFGYSDRGHVFLNSNGNGFRRMVNGSDVIKHEIGHYLRTENTKHLNDMLQRIADRTKLSKQQVLDRLTTKLHTEVKAYSPMADENFADMFSLMIDGKEYSKGAMLFYDMAGGVSIPNKVIGGMKYNDYMAKLYQDADNILVNYIL